MAHSPPLPLLSLIPSLDRHQRRPGSFISTVSGTSSSAHSVPPPSSYRQHSQLWELHRSLLLVAPVLDKSESLGLSQLKDNPVTTPLNTHQNLATGINNMSTTPQPPSKKPGFFRRMSLSSSQNKPVVQASTNTNGLPNGANHHGRSTGAAMGKDVMAGPSYESIPVRTAPSAFRNEQSRSVDTQNPKPSNGLPPRFQPASPVRQQSTPTPIAAAFVSDPSAQAQSLQTSPPRSRYPIHPALASPPTSPPRRMSASSPYDSVKPKAPLAVRSVSTRAPLNGQSAKEVPNGLAQGHSVNSSGQSQAPSAPRSSSYNQQTNQAIPRPSTTPPDHTPSPNVQRTTRTPPVASPLPVSHDSRLTTSSRSIPQRGVTTRSSRFDDADAINSASLPEGAQASVYTQSKLPDARGMVSARRSTSSSRRTPIAKVEKHTAPTASMGDVSGKSSTLEANDRPRNQEMSHVKQKEQLSEAGAYAKAVAATMGAREPPATPPTTIVTPKKPQMSRPLPAPPSPSVPKSSSKVNMVVIASSSPQPKTSPKNVRRIEGTNAEQAQTTTPLSITTLSPSPRDKRASQQPLNFDFPRSPTLPPLVDPRSSKDSQVDPISQWTPNAGSSKTPTTSQIPPRLSSSHSRRNVSSPLASPSLTSGRQTSAPPKQSPMTSPSSQKYAQHNLRFKERPRATITFLLLHTPIQATLLSHLSINSFLSLTGASKAIRKRFTGETVGRWVMSEWGLQVDRDKGRSWPNLTVWEGFLESLLHDPATYSTYPAQWYNLLQHLCLSHTLIVLHLRQLPLTAFPNPPPLPFDDNMIPAVPSLPMSNSTNSFGSQRPRSRLGSVAGSDAGSLAPGTKMPRQERLVEIVMPEPLAGQERKDNDETFPITQKVHRRGSIGSIASAASLSFGRRRSASISTGDMPLSSPAAPMASGKAALPPVSYPAAKRYGFKRHGEPMRSRQSSESSRPGSIFSVQSTPSLSGHQRVSSIYSERPPFTADRRAPPVPGFPVGLSMPPPIGGGPRSSFNGSDARSNRRSENGSPISGMIHSRRATGTPPPHRPEPSFDRPIPYTTGRVPILRVFVPLSDAVHRWPSAEGAAAAVKELEKCGALRRMKLGDLVVNTAIRQPKSTEHVLVYVPFVRHLLIPLDYTFSPGGQIPSCVNAFDVPPSYYYPFLPTPQIIYLDLSPFAKQALQSIRLAYDRRDVTVASGARLSAKRYLHVAGFEIRQEDRVAPEWQGMVSLEAEGTAEGKQDIERRLVGSNGARPIVGPWELVREKSMMGTIWLRLIKPIQQT